MRKFYPFLTLIVLLLLSGCMYLDKELLNPGIQKQKGKILVQGQSRLVNYLKRSLRDNGWTVISNLGVSSKSFNSENNIKLFSPTIKVDYVLNVTAYRYDSCLSSGAYNVTISVASLQSGEEALTITGNACGTDIVRHFEELMFNKKSKW